MSLKDKVRIGAGIFSGGVVFILYLLLGGLGLLIHLFTMIIAWSFSGLLAAVVSLALPVLAQIYWLIYLWKETGMFLNYYTILNLAYIGILIVALGAAFAAAYLFSED